MEERFERLALHLCSAFSDKGHWGVSLAAGEGSGCLGSGDGVFAYFPVVNVSIGIPSRGSLERNRSFAGDGFSVDAHFKDLSCQSADVSKMLLAAGFCKGEFAVAVVPFPSGCLGHSGVMASFHGSRDTDAPYVLAGVLSSVMDGLEMDGAVGQGGSLADSSARSA